MGSLNNCSIFLNLPVLKQLYKLESFVETGTYRGDSVQAAIDFGFQPIFSVELYKEFADAAKARFSGDSRVTVLNGTSEEMLPGIIPQLKGNTLWWLDAHLQNTYKGTPSQKYDNQFPLDIELQLMLKYRDCSKDIILVDDLRVYEDGPFQHGNAPAHHSCSKAGIDFVVKLLEKTHNVRKFYQEEGYIVCTPKQIP